MKTVAIFLLAAYVAECGDGNVAVSGANTINGNKNIQLRSDSN